MYCQSRQIKNVKKMETLNTTAKFANNYGYSDVAPYEVVKTVSEKCIEVRAMDYEQTVFPTQFHIGGFSANCADQDRQDYNYTSNTDNTVIKVRYSAAKRQWQDAHGRKFILGDKPVRFYDYNF